LDGTSSGIRRLLGVFNLLCGKTLMLNIYLTDHVAVAFVYMGLPLIRFRKLNYVRQLGDVVDN
jgi:hypothetical protein